MKSQGLVTLVIALLSHTVVLTTCQFMVQPVSVVQAQGLDAVFECRYPGASNYLWKLNGEFLTDDSYPLDVTVSPPSGDTPATLTIQATAQYKNTVVQCVALVRGEQRFIPELSVNSTLQVQEPLPAVADLTVAGNCLQLNVTWVAPFSLNLTTAEPDIQYCVDVFDVTYEREENLLQSECNITTTQYLFDVPYLVDTYRFSVTPRSNIDGSLNGTISTGQFSYDTRTDTPTPVTDVVDNSTTVIVGGIAAAAAATVVIIAFLVVIVFVWRRKRREKRTLVVEMQNTSLLENDYDPPLSLNREYSVPSEAAGGPPPIPAYQYENVELMSLTRATEPPVSIDEPPPSYYAAATCTSKPFKQDMDKSSVLSSSPDHVPISANWTRHNVSTLERSNHDTSPNHSANNRVTQAMGASENKQVASVYLHMERGTSSMKNPTQQPVPSCNKHTKPLEESTSSEAPQSGSMPDEPHSQSVEPAPKDPVYDVAKKDLANSTPTQNNNKTEIPVVYADLDVKPKANSSPPMQHPVVYALIDESSLAPRSVEKNTPCILPSLPPPLTAESVLAEIYPVAKRWEALGEALGIKEHHLDSFSTEGHEQVCLYDMILYYFTFGPRSWEDIVKALWEIGETEAADKIIRNGKCTVELPVTSPTETPPPLPPRNDTTMAASHQTEAGELSHDDWQDHSVQKSNTESTEEHQGSVLAASHQVIAVGESDEYNSEVHFPRSTGLGNKSKDGPTGRKINSLASTLNTINKMPYFPTICKSAVHDPIPDKEEPTVPYCTTMIHSLRVFEKLDVPRNHKVRALGYFSCGQSALLKALYQQRMAAADEVHENNVSHIVPQNDDTTIKNNGYTVKQSVGDSSNIPLLKRGETVTSTPNTNEIQSTRVRDGEICYLEVVSCPGELELARQVQRLPFEYLITSNVNESLLSQWLRNTVRWFNETTLNRCPLIQKMVTRLIYFDQTLAECLECLLPFSVLR